MKITKEELLVALRNMVVFFVCYVLLSLLFLRGWMSQPSFWITAVLATVASTLVNFVLDKFSRGKKDDE